MNYDSNSNYIIINIKYRRGLGREVHHHGSIFPSTIAYVTKSSYRHVFPTSDNCYKLQVTSLTRYQNSLCVPKAYHIFYQGWWLGDLAEVPKLWEYQQVKFDNFVFLF